MRTPVLLSLAVAVTAGQALATINVRGTADQQARWNAKIQHCRTNNAWFRNFYDNIDNSTKVINIVLVESEARCYVDTFANDKVDLDDIDDFPELDPPQIADQCEIIIHILAERFHHACHGTGYLPAHQHAFTQQRAYRQALGYTDWVESIRGDPRNRKRVCWTWRDTAGRRTITYTPVAEDRSEGAADHASTTTTGGVTEHRFVVDATTTVDTLVLPPSLGGGTVESHGTGGTFTVAATESPEFPAFLELTMVDLRLDTADTTFPTGSIGSTTITHTRTDFGYYNPATGQFAIVYEGLLVNEAMGSYRTYSQVTGNWAGGQASLTFRTATVMLDSEIAVAEPEMEVTGPVAVGSTTTVTLDSPAEPFGSYGVLFAMSDEPRIRFADGSSLPFDPNDPLFLDGASGMSTVFLNNFGTLDAAGQGSMQIAVPPLNELRGLQFSGCFFTMIAGLPVGASEPVYLTIQ